MRKNRKLGQLNPINAHLTPKNINCCGVAGHFYLTSRFNGKKLRIVAMNIDFYLRFKTQFGEALYITGNLEALGNNNVVEALPMNFFNDDFWHVSIKIEPGHTEPVQYHYIFKDINGGLNEDAEELRIINTGASNIITIDTWNYRGDIAHSFYTAPFKKVFFKEHKKGKIKKQDFTHVFKVKAPLIKVDESVCLLGNTEQLGNWVGKNAIQLEKEGDWWTAYLDLSNVKMPVIYKYGIYNTKHKELVRFEDGDNRNINFEFGEDQQITIHDGFVRLPYHHWKGAGVSVPVFSLRSAESFGIGEFNDIKLLADWAEKTRLKLIQLLPVNDTTATYSWKDSYPYAAISAFALHPIYISLQKVAGKKNNAIIKALNRKKKQLNALPEIDYETILNFKINTLRELYDLHPDSFLKDEEFISFFDSNKHWLLPYSAFCFLRDKYGTSEFSNWKTFSVYNEEEVARLCALKSKQFKDIAFWYFVQYHLHLQLKDAVKHAHKKGVVLKGDIPIGIYRYGCDAWMNPELFFIDKQAGAPPDDFAIKGQNWGFPTYNWLKMKEDDFAWWRSRFDQMSYYFDAFRIDHILGFFRIWSIPMHAVEGILGRFVPAIPLTANDFSERGITIDHNRLCKPFITEKLVHQTFGDHADFVKVFFLQTNDEGRYDLKEEFSTQQKLAAYFNNQESSEENKFVMRGLFDLVSNVILLEDEVSTDAFHFRINIDTTSSFQYLDDAFKHALKELYIYYFYKLQDDVWKNEALKKLPALKEATDMLICGEDLGMVPHCVPEVMQQLGILSLEIQRMPKNPATVFFNPKNAPYLSVVTPSTHDMSTVRAWWEEDKQKTQQFYNSILEESGDAPFFCEPWINTAIVMQHLYSPAMWSIFQIQDLTGMNAELRRNNPQEERINIPAVAEHYWRYRMHITLEDLIKEKDFNKHLKELVEYSGRG